ncbi:TnsD family Tn7-like transposition protein [Pseudomonas sp. 14P_8.1_Bac3]|uniref:TnsD family Tn7-like transposition protein n=1 Tax=Pseudomonas sp. 14P_8.1_Bac3 TaxID=2971621 RepID=UPI0021C80DEB|nr:TnsD family Tn7-like transposition protein [Pseudomonas sp. 14P_8.1_Bac3]MCU1762838.1 TnsD family Tn7-like transposition protein [Pseudomonas sp. 14P_8.1_Bac3]
MNSLVKDRCDSGSPVEIAERRRNFQSDRDKKLHDRQGYYWLYRHDRDWLQNYVKSYPFIRTRKVYVDWFSRDIALSNELVTAHAEIMAEKDKPKKITKSALLRRVQNHYGFLRKSSKFPKSIQVLESLLETEHDYQLRKVAWALKELQLPKNYAISVIMRLAGIRIRQISHLEIEDLLQARGNGDNL